MPRARRALKSARPPGEPLSAQNAHLAHGVAESAVAYVAGYHDLLPAGGAGDRGGPGVVLTGLRIGETVGVTGLGENPGAEAHAEIGLAGVDVSVRVTAKIGGYHLIELAGVTSSADRDNAASRAAALRPAGRGQR